MDFVFKPDASGATGSSTWSASRFLADELDASTSCSHTTLELGAGAGYLAMHLAARGPPGTRVIATDVSDRIRHLRWNVNRNQLGHAVRLILDAF